MTNKQILQKHFKVDNIRQLKRKLPFLRPLGAAQIYSMLKIALPQIEQNLAINENKKHSEKVQNIKHERKVNEFKKKIANKKIGSFLKSSLIKRRYLIHVTIRRTYKRSGKEFILHDTKGPFNDNINSHVNAFNVDNDYQIDTVIDYNVEYMNEERYRNLIRNQNTHLMRRDGFIIKNTWLKYGQGISKKAFENSNNKCVYYQLLDYLLNPKTGRPTKFISKGTRMSEQNLFEYFKHLDFFDNYNSEFCIYTGVNTHMIKRLCIEIGRNMYAYDDDDKCFDSVIQFKSDHYAPVVFYKMHGHFYLINDPKIIKRVGESNKNTVKKIISNIIEEKEQKEMEKLKVNLIDIFDVENAKQYEEGIYLIQKSNLNEEILSFITIYKEVPKTKNNDNVIIKFIYKNENDKDVYIVVDANYGHQIEYDDIKKVAEQNDISYVNEGIGNVIMEVIKKSKKGVREPIDDTTRNEIINAFNKKCAVCELECDYFEIDHIVPVCVGGNNDTDNLQPLCKDCHKNKSLRERKEGMYNYNDEIVSSFNGMIWENIMKTIFVKSWQFVEIIDADEYKNSFKVDTRKCRRNILFNSKYEFPVYSVMDIPNPFSGIVKCGMYFVETSNVFPFRGDGWYLEPLIVYGLENNIIQMENIKMEFIPSKTLNANYFKDNINTLLNAFECVPSLQKMSINAYIGCMGKLKRTACFSKFSLDVYEASNWMTDNKKDVFIKTHKLDGETFLYEGIHSEEIISECTAYPIYSMILQMEAMELHKLENIIIDNGGKVLDRNTDAIRYACKKEIDLFNEYWDDDKTILKYQREEPQTVNNF